MAASAGGVTPEPLQPIKTTVSIKRVRGRMTIPQQTSSRARPRKGRARAPSAVPRCASHDSGARRAHVAKTTQDPPDVRFAPCTA